MPDQSKAASGRGRALLSLLAAALAWIGLGGAAARADDAKGPLVQASLTAERASVAPGGAVWLGVRLRIAPQWHVYWVNPGDSGTPVKVTWTLPPGFRAGPLVRPAPISVDVEGIVSYAHEGDVLLMARLEAPAGAATGTKAAVKASVDWLVCHETCIPGSAEVSLEVAVASGEGALTAEAPLFAEARTRLPSDGRALGWRAALAAQSESTLTLVVAAPAGLSLEGRALLFFHDTEGFVEAGKPQKTGPADPALLGPGAVAITLPRASATRKETLASLSGVLSVKGGAAGAAPLSVTLDTAPSGVPDGPKTGAASAPAASGLLAIAVSAFLGGLILNLMPCVFPVLAIKVLSFVEQGGEDPRKARLHGLVFAGGVLASFLALGGLLLALRAAGNQLGWGFQLQSPVVIGSLALLFFGISLNFLGLFEIGEGVSGVVGEHARRQGYLGSFFSGALATAVATPCTAPFMGSALGFALVAPPHEALLVFGALGLGMAAPYVALTSFPALVRVLPRPGRWMVIMKEAMAFPMLATVLWLAWVLGLQAGPEGVVGLLGGMTLVGFAVWWRKTITPPEVEATGARRVAGLVGTLASLVGAVALGLPWSEAASGDAHAGAPGTSGASAGDTVSYGVTWARWSQEAVAAARREGRVVYVDFTAAWCITCQANKKVVFSSDEVRARFGEKGVIAMRADWTKKDAAITRALEEHGRTGVPLNLVYPASGGAPEVLPAVLTPAVVLEALERARGK